MRVYWTWVLVMRGIEWSLRAVADMQAVRLFSRARAVIKCAFRKYRMQVASTFPIAGISLSLKRNLVRQGNVAYTSSKTVQ